MQFWQSAGVGRGLTMRRSVSAMTALALASLVAPATTLAQNAYITNFNDGTVSVISTATDTVVGSPIPVGIGPFGVAVAPDGRKVYIANELANAVSVIDAATNTVIGSPIFVGLDPVGVAVTPDSRKAYVANTSGNTVSVIDTATDMVSSTVTVGSSPFGVAITPDGRKVYVANTGDPPTVSVIDTATDAVSTVTVGFHFGAVHPTGVAVTPNGRKVYVTIVGDPTQGGSTVWVIDTATDTVIGAIPVKEGGGPTGVAVTPDGSKVYVADVNAKMMSVISTATNAVTTFPLAGEPYGVAITPDGSKVYVPNLSDGTVSVIDTATDTVIGSPIPVGTTPFAFGIFIQPAKKFAGTAGRANCHGKSVSALAVKYDGIKGAAATLGYPSVSELQAAIVTFCEG